MRSAGGGTSGRISSIGGAIGLGVDCKGRHGCFGRGDTGRHGTRARLQHIEGGTGHPGGSAAAEAYGGMREVILPGIIVGADGVEGIIRVGAASPVIVGTLDMVSIVIPLVGRRDTATLVKAGSGSIYGALLHQATPVATWPVHGEAIEGPPNLRRMRVGLLSKLPEQARRRHMDVV